MNNMAAHKDCHKMTRKRGLSPVNGGSFYIYRTLDTISVGTPFSVKKSATALK